MVTEIWKDIEGYEGRYQVSNLGRVKSLQRIVPCGISSYNNKRIIPERILHQHKDQRSGYMFVSLSKNSRLSEYVTHRLVVAAFIPNFYNKPEVNHIDGNPSNNNVENLE